MDTIEPQVQTTDFNCRVIKTPFRVKVKAESLGMLVPNANMVTVAVSRNIRLAELIDGTVEFRLPDDAGTFRKYLLLDVNQTVTEWHLSLITIPDDNKPVPQTYTVPDLSAFDL